MNAALLLVVLGLFGSVALALMAFALGFNKNLRLASAADVAAHIARFVPGAIVVANAIDRTQKMALARCADAKLYLLVSMGDRVSVRTITADQVKPQNHGHLRIDLGDIGVPTLDFYADQASLSGVTSDTKED